MEQWHPKVVAYVQNHHRGFQGQYCLAPTREGTIPNFIVLIYHGRRPRNLTDVIVDEKSYRCEDAEQNKSTLETHLVPGVKNVGTHGRWACIELTDVHQMGSDFEAAVVRACSKD